MMLPCAKILAAARFSLCEVWRSHRRVCWFSMKKTSFSAFSLFCAMSAQDACADIFRCTNAAGKLLTSDKPIPECQSRATKIYKNNGILKAEIAAPLTPEQKKKLEQEAERRKVEQLAEEEQKREERYLNAHYRSEADIEVARKRAVGALDDKRKLAFEQLNTINQNITLLQVELSKSKKSSSEYELLRQRAEDLSQSVLNNRSVIAFYDQEILRTHKEYDETLARYKKYVSGIRK